MHILCIEPIGRVLTFVLLANLCVPVYEWGTGSGDFTLIGIQLIAILFTVSWTITVMGVFFYFINWMGWFRVDALEEEIGMDIGRHKGSAYDIAVLDEQIVDQWRSSRRSIMEDRTKKMKILAKGESTMSQDEVIVADYMDHPMDDGGREE
jgi:Ammonium Transporter Family